MSRTPVLPCSIAGRRESAHSHSPPLTCSWTDSSPDAAWVRLAGALDFATVSQLSRTLREVGTWARLIVFDLRELERIDYFGVHAIANASSRAREIGRRLVVVSGVQEIDRMFTLAGRRHEVEIGNVESGEPAAQALRRLATQQLEPHNGRPSPEVGQRRPLR